MRRDLDLVRALLLKLEAVDIAPGEMDMVDPDDEVVAVEGYEADQIAHHLVWLLEAGLVVGEDPFTGSIGFRRVSCQGADFLDTVRDPEVWKRTKDGASKMGGWTFGLLKDLGTAYLKHVAKERLGLEL